MFASGWRFRKKCNLLRLREPCRLPRSEIQDRIFPQKGATHEQPRLTILASRVLDDSSGHELPHDCRGARLRTLGFCSVGWAAGDSPRRRRVSSLAHHTAVHRRARGLSIGSRWRSGLDGIFFGDLSNRSLFGVLRDRLSHFNDFRRGTLAKHHPSRFLLRIWGLGASARLSSRGRWNARSLFFSKSGLVAQTAAWRLKR